MGTLANSVDPDEMPHNVAFHQGLPCLLRENRSSFGEKKGNIFFWKLYGKFNWSKKGNKLPLMGYCIWA